MLMFVIFSGPKLFEDLILEVFFINEKEFRKFSISWYEIPRSSISI
jgi:hypothetical protein